MITINGNCCECNNQMTFPATTVNSHVRAVSLVELGVHLPSEWIVVPWQVSQTFEILCPTCAKKQNAEVIAGMKRQIEKMEKARNE